MKMATEAAQDHAGHLPRLRELTRNDRNRRNIACKRTQHAQALLQCTC
jgi:hypothetical protein